MNNQFEWDVEPRKSNNKWMRFFAIFFLLMFLLAYFHNYEFERSENVIFKQTDDLPLENMEDYDAVMQPKEKTDTAQNSSNPTPKQISHEPQKVYNTDTKYWSKDFIKPLTDIVYLESWTKCSDFEKQLIVECVLYRWWEYQNKKGACTLTQYLNKNPTIFQGWNNKIRTDLIEHLKDIPLRLLDQIGYWESNVKRYKSIESVVRNRVNEGAPRVIKYYHHQKVKGKIKYADGTTRSLNKKHIKAIENRTDLVFLNPTTDLELYHDFYELKTVPEAFTVWRNRLKNTKLALNE